MFVDVIKMNWFGVLIAVVGVIIAFKLLKRFFRRLKYNLPPGPKGLPVLGNVVMIDHNYLSDHNAKYGEISYMNILGTDIVIFNTADCIKDALNGPATRDVFNDRPETFMKNYIVHEDVVFRSPNESNWSQRRQLIQTILKQYGEGIGQIEQVVSAELLEVIELLGNKIGHDVDMNDYFESSMCNIINILITGERHDYESKRMKVLREGLGVSIAISDPATAAVLTNIPVLRFLPFGVGALFQQVRDFAQTIIKISFEEPRRLPISERESRKGVVFDMYKLQSKHDWLSDSNVIGIVEDIWGAAYVATKSSLYAFIAILLHYPDVQKRIQSEIDEVVGRNRRPNLSDRGRMHYMNATIIELTRYASTAALAIPHACAKDTQFRGYTVPRDCVLIQNLFCIHHDDKVWGNPKDFNPSRFLDDSGKVLPADHPIHQNMLPFGVGKRDCVGRDFAKTRIFLFIAFLLQEFTFTPADDIPSRDPRDFVANINIFPKPYKVRVERRA